MLTREERLWLRIASIAYTYDSITTKTKKKLTYRSTLRERETEREREKKNKKGDSKASPYI